AVGPDQPDPCAGRDDEVEATDERPAAARHREPAPDEQPARSALRRCEVDSRGGREPARAGVLELLDQAPGLLDAALGLRGARLGTLTEPLDLAAHGVGERILERRLPA